MDDKKTIIEETVLPASTLIFIIMITVGTVMTYLPIYALSINVKDISLYYLINAITLIVIRPIVGKYSDKSNKSKILFSGMLSLIVGFIILSFSNSIQWFLAFGIFYGIGLGIVQPLLNAQMLIMSPQNKRGIANSTYFSAMDLGVGIGSILLGFLIQWYGFRLVFFSCTFIIVIALILYITYIKKFFR